MYSMRDLSGAVTVLLPRPVPVAPLGALVAHAVAWGPFAQCPPFPDTCDLLRGAGGVKAGFNPVGGEKFSAK